LIGEQARRDQPVAKRLRPGQPLVALAGAVAHRVDETQRRASGDEEKSLTRLHVTCITGVTREGQRIHAACTAIQAGAPGAARPLVSHLLTLSGRYSRHPDRATLTSAEGHSR